MNQLTAHKREYTRKQADLYLAFELGSKEWKLGFSVGFAQGPRERTVLAGDLSGVKREIERAKRRFGLFGEARVLSCYEAGRDGFWLHRYLVHMAVRNLVVDSSSIEVNRRARRAKTDKMDLGKLLTMLMRCDNGERKVWSVVMVPTVEQEDSRQLHRDLEALRGGAHSAYQPDQGAFGKLRGSDKGGPRLFGSIGEGASVGWEAATFGIEEAPRAGVRAA